MSRSKDVYTSIVACTDDDDEVEYLNRWDIEIPNLDVVDDFRNERAEIKGIKGADFHFTFGDYVVKSLIGSIDPELDNMDEAPGNTNAAANSINRRNILKLAAILIIFFIAAFFYFIFFS